VAEDPASVSIALDDPPMEPEPDWTRLDILSGCRIREWTIDRGRPTEFAKTDTGTLKDGQISFGYSLESAASDVTLSVKDSSGNTVWTGSGTTTSGTNSFTWDGTATDGTQLTDGGQYTLNVSATDSTGQSVYGYTTVTGKVTSIDNSSGTPMLNIGSTSVSTSNVIGVTS